MTQAFMPILNWHRQDLDIECLTDQEEQIEGACCETAS